MSRKRGAKASPDAPYGLRERPMLLASLDNPDTGCFEVHEGERVVLLGASGSGKTTLLRQLLGITGPPRLRRGSPLAQRCAYVPETDGVFLDLSVLANVERPTPHARRIPAEEALDWLDLVGLSALAHRHASELSTASRRRVALARALSRRAPLLIIDGDLDGTLRPLLSTLLECVPHLSSVVTATCTADDLAWNADSVVLVDSGRVVAQGPLPRLAVSQDVAVRTALRWVSP